jgi:hypothetical protein
MHWSDIPFDPPRKTLRQFAGLWLLAFGGLAVWEYAQRGHGTWALALAILALTVGPLGLVWPRLVRPIYVGWMVLAFPIGWLVSRLILAVMFYGVFTPVALVFRLIGRDALTLKCGEGRTTYWVPKPPPAGVRSYFNQF